MQIEAQEAVLDDFYIINIITITVQFRLKLKRRCQTMV